MGVNVNREDFMAKNKNYQYYKKFKFLIYMCIILSLSLVIFHFSGDVGFSKKRDEGQKTASLTTMKPGESVSGNVDQYGNPLSKESEQGGIKSGNKTHQLTLLLLGTDKRPTDKCIGNTDTLIVTRINTDSGQIALLSVPRDTEVDIPGFGKGKVNAVARMEKGPQSTKSELEQLLGLQIDGYILTNFAGFKDIIDTLGGVTLNVEKNMYYETGDAEDGIINLKKGEQHLNGSQALQYIRFRHDQLGDITRTMRQQKLLKAVVSEFMQLKTLPKLPWLIPEIYQMVETDLSEDKLWSLANVFIHINAKEIISETLPGNFYTEKGISYWKVSPEKCRVTTSQLFNNGKTTSIFSDDINQVQAEQNGLQITNGRKKSLKEKVSVNSLSDDGIQVEIQYGN